MGSGVRVGVKVVLGAIVWEGEAERVAVGAEVAVCDGVLVGGRGGVWVNDGGTVGVSVGAGGRVVGVAIGTVAVAVGAVAGPLPSSAQPATRRRHSPKPRRDLS